MNYYSVYRQRVRFLKVWRPNVHDIRKACLETTLSVYVCFVAFYVFVLDETHVVGPKLVYEHILSGNIQVRLHIGPTKGP